MNAQALLEEMAAAGAANPTLPARRPQIAKVRYTHEAMADLILENPWISQNEIAAYFGYSPAWISVAINSDAFQAYLAARKEEMIDPELRASINERFKAVTVQSLKVLTEKLARPANEVSDALALKAAELGAKARAVLHGRFSASVDDVRAVALPTLRHRIVTNFNAEAEGVKPDDIIRQLIESAE